MARDTLALLARLRRLSVAAAQGVLADAQLRARDAELRQAAAAALLLAERNSGGADYAAWHPRGVAARDAAGRDAAQAETRRAAALGVLVAARTAERSVERLAEERAKTAHRDALRRDTIRLEEAAYPASTPRRT
ncbi:hypothetical protein ACQW02_23075 [Humitalea sp. 24SJ18S-53]|uniref:hypothetical protein n=1 Tax=Humitalea sp. 24SJ18S-53 TaxID=3422307 RepID=UPI003D66566A